MMIIQPTWPSNDAIKEWLKTKANSGEDGQKSKSSGSSEMGNQSRVY